MRNRPLQKSMGLLLVVGSIAACGDQGQDAEPPATTTEGSDTPAQVAPAPTTQPTGETGAGQVAAGANQDAIETGRQIYSGAGICFTCHGQEGQGTALGPNLADGDWIWIEEPADEQNLHTQIVTLIRTGVTEPAEHPAPMPPMGGANLSDEQLDALGWYIISLNQS